MYRRVLLNLIILLLLPNIILLLPKDILAGIRGEKVATTASPFLKIGVGARACGMGEAFAGLSNDVSAIYWNPAGILQISQPELIAVHNHWISDINHEFIAYAHPVDENVTVGVGAILLYIDDLERRNAPTVEPISEFTASDTLFIFSLASKLNHKTTLGGSIKFILQRIDAQKTGNLAFDLGALAQINDRSKLGIVLQNIGFKAKIYKEDFSLPIWLKLGIAYNLFEYLHLTSDMTLYKDNNPTYSFGLEYSFNKIVFLRVGYKKKSSKPQEDILSNVTLGVGFSVLNSQIDYAYIPYEDVGNSHRISLTLKFR